MLDRSASASASASARLRTVSGEGNASVQRSGDPFQPARQHPHARPTEVRVVYWTWPRSSSSTVLTICDSATSRPPTRRLTAVVTPSSRRPSAKDWHVGGMGVTIVHSVDAYRMRSAPPRIPVVEPVVRVCRHNRLQGDRPRHEPFPLVSMPGVAVARAAHPRTASSIPAIRVTAVLLVASYAAAQGTPVPGLHLTIGGGHGDG